MPDYYLLKALTNWQPLTIATTQSSNLMPNTLTCLRDILPQAHAFSCISFDLFDTLIHRNGLLPKHVTKTTATWLSAYLQSLGVHLSVQKLLHLRTAAEQQARQNALDQGGDGEPSIQHIFQNWLTHIYTHAPHLTPFLSVQKLVDFEVEQEKLILVCAPYAQQVLQKLKQKKKHLVVISDMHLGTTHIEQILQHLKISTFIDAIYVSSEYQYSKNTGRLFQHLLKTQQLSLNTLHVGDHLMSDVKQAQCSGLRAVHFQNPNLYNKQFQVKALNLWGDTSHLWLAHNQPTHPIEKIGYQRLGAIFTLFALHTLQCSLKKNYAFIFFLARDGYLFHQIFTQLRSHIHLFKDIQFPKDIYLHLSRASAELSNPFIQPMELHSLSKRVNSKKADNILNMLLNEQENPSLQAYLQENQRKLRAYLNQNQLTKNHNSLVIDIGWKGSIFTSLEQAFSQEAWLKNIDVLLWGRRSNPSLKNINVLPGFVYDEDRENPIENILPTYSEFFECLASPIEGSVIGYDEAPDRRVHPKYAPYEIQPQQRLLVTQLQQGIKAWCTDFILFYNRYQPNIESLKTDAVIQTTRFLSGQYPQELTLLEDLEFDCGWGQQHRIRLHDYFALQSSPSLQNNTPSYTSDMLHISFLETDTPSPQFFFEKLHQFIEVLKSETRIIVYGVGTVSQIISPLIQERIVCFIDANQSTQNQLFLNKHVYCPDYLSPDMTTTIIVTPLGRKDLLQKRLAHYSGHVFYVEDIFTLT